MTLETEPQTSTVADTDTAASNRRRSVRTQEPSIEVRCEGDIYGVIDWSFGGCQIDNYSGYLRPGDQVSLGVYLLGFHDCDCLSLLAEVTRFVPEENNALALEFKDFTARKFMSYCDRVENYIRTNNFDIDVQQVENSST